MKLLIKTLILPLAFLSLLACEKSDYKHKDCNCIKKLIKEQEPILEKVTYYSYNGQDVYLFEESSEGADRSAILYDENCNELCVFSGIAGNTGGCDDFETNATNEKLVWKK
jgi:hypothetical protein